MSSFRQTYLDPASAGNILSKQRAETTRIAKEQEKAIHEKLSRNNHPIPKYEFLELIGKGAYGRVFKACDQVDNRIVALKVIDVDSHDYKVNAKAKDESIEVTMHEIKVLKQLKDSKTKNVNIILDAFQIHSQLWIVSEYCPGGSVRTLMRATGDKLEDKYIIPIARELAIALKAIHEEGIIHRDIKGANIMIHEEGRLQVIDFGVAGVLQTNIDKRSTVIGTPHWMAPEMHKLAPREGLNYGTEVDVWAYGCTLYEIATGTPPYPKTQPGRMLGATLGRAPPRLDKTQHSEGLSDLVAFVLESKPADRPSMHQVLEHPYIRGSEDTHPTESLAELVRTYYCWEHSGGQRQSLFINAGAAAAEFPPTLIEEDDWNFSTTSNFEQELEGFSFDPETIKDVTTTVTPDAPGIYNGQVAEYSCPTPIAVPEIYSRGSKEAASQGGEHWTPTGDQTLIEKLNTEERVKRGEKALKGLFNEQKPPYEYKVKADFIEQTPVPTMGALGKPLSRTRSDLPLRDESVESAVHRKEIDTDHLRSASYDTTPNIDLANVGTIKANRMNRFIDNMGHDDKSDSSPFYGQNGAEKRATKEWTFPQTLYRDANGKDSETPTVAFEPKRATIEWGFPEMHAAPKDPQPMYERPALRPALKHMATAPESEVRQSIGDMIDLDALYDSELYDSDILRTAPVSDDEALSGVTSEDEGIFRSSPNEGSNAPLVKDDANMTLPTASTSGTGIAAHPNLSVAPSGSVRMVNDYDPFLFEDSSDDADDDTKAEIDSLLERDGVTDIVDRAKLRRSYIKARKTGPRYLKKDMEKSGYLEFKNRRFATPLGDYSERVEASYIWEQHQNPITDSRAYINMVGNGLQTRFASTAGSMHGENKIITASALAAAAAAFPQFMPPTAEALAADAPASVLESEMKRFMEDWISGLDVLGDIFKSSLPKDQKRLSNMSFDGSISFRANG